MFPFERSRGPRSGGFLAKLTRPLRRRAAVRRILTLGITLALTASILAPTAIVLAAAPVNDTFTAAMAMDPSALPFNVVVDNTEATTEPGEPSWCSPESHSLWYSLTPTTSGVLAADMSGSAFYDTNLTVYVAFGPGISDLAVVEGGSGSTCYGGNSVRFRVQAGSTYYIQAGTIYSGGGSLHLNVAAVAPPANDNFANATMITNLPFSSTVDAAASTVEAGEPSTTCAGPANSVWYTITPSAAGSLSASVPEYWSSFAVFSGGSLASLTQIGCRNFGGMVTFPVAAGVTYSFQLVPLNPIGAGLLHLNVVVTPPPQANFSLYPGDPSIYDTIQFYDNSYDPGGMGIASQAWAFGDGTTVTGCCPTHHFAADGNYTVKLAVTTYDGRTASASQVVRVATHDVAITKLTVPTSASAGQTRQITVGIGDNRYPEVVQVQLSKANTSGGFETIGMLTQSVPVRGANRTTSFTFNYTFTNADATIGKVTFRVDAPIQGARDALPGDNTAIALPTKVTR